jgi:Secretion system C-terminal sorting domain
MKSKFYFALVLISLFSSALKSAVFEFPTTSPIEWMSFKGKATPAGNLLTWDVSVDMQTKGFEIERLNPNHIGWETLGFVNGNLTKMQYQFIDNQPFAITYYRLRCVDFDEKKVASVAVSVVAQRPNTPILKAYPTPVYDYLKVELTESTDFQIINLMGQIVMNGQTAQYIPVFALPKGTYILKVGSDQIKFVKQ